MNDLNDGYYNDDEDDEDDIDELSIIPMPRARQSHPETSQEAMDSLDERTMRIAAEMAIQVFRTHGPMPDYLFKPLFLAVWNRPASDSMHRMARSIARDMGFIVDTKLRVVNPATKRRQVLWAYVPDPKPPLLHRCPYCNTMTRRRETE